jgi:hypothetical protein
MNSGNDCRLFVQTINPIKMLLALW